jgi:hypothetical protein
VNQRERTKALLKPVETIDSRQLAYGAGKPVRGPEVAASVGIPEPTAGIPKVAKIPRNVVIRHEHLAQDGQTAGETAVREALWRLAERRGSTGMDRIVSAGYHEIAKEARLSVNSVKSNLAGLRLKKAIEGISSKISQSGTSYRVFGYREVLERRKAAGMTHYVKMNGSVRYVDPASGIPIVGVPEVGSGIPTFGTPGIPTFGTSGIPTVGTPIYIGILSRNSKEWALAKLKEQNADPSDVAIAQKVLGIAE